MSETTIETRVVTGRRLAWADSDDRHHPPHDHWCACSCEDVVLARCPEHGWQVALTQTRTVTVTPWRDATDDEITPTARRTP